MTEELDFDFYKWIREDMTENGASQYIICDRCNSIINIPNKGMNFSREHCPNCENADLNCLFIEENLPELDFIPWICVDSRISMFLSNFKSPIKVEIIEAHNDND